MLRLLTSAGVSLAALFFVIQIAPTTARACGGCFGPIGQPSTVTAHRMAVSLSPEQTVLWDQFQYAGSPEDFVWVLPVATGPDVRIELADDAFFAMLADNTRVTLQAPPPPSSGGGAGIGCGGGDAAFAGTTDTEGVNVVRQEVVGPYETLVIESTEGNTLVDWLQTNGYAVPDNLRPTITHYVDEGLGFAVLRLSPNAGVQQIQPVRVITPGLMPIFPLRMVAAGVSDEVSLELFIVADGRWEAQSFPNAQIADDEIVYDWDSGLFNYDAVAAEKLAANEGRTWLTEYSMPAYSIAPDAWSYTDATGYHSPLDDWAVAVRGLGAERWVTRMRAVLPVGALTEDLVLSASTAGPRPGFINVTNEVNRPSFAPPGVAAPTDRIPPPVVLALWLVVIAAALSWRHRAKSMAR